MQAKLVSALLLAATAAVPAVSQNLTGAGATFPNPIYSRWFSEYAQQHPNVHINYQSVGSGAGIHQLQQKIVDFGASDMPLTDEMMHQFNPPVLNIPTVLGAVVPVYNVPGVTNIRFAPEVIAGIYLGVIKNWNDPNIQHDNPGVKLPNHAIEPVYRSDGSGTTFIFTDFLSKVVPLFQQRIGRGTSVKWGSVGIGQKGNEGVAGMVRGTPYSFGYVELIYAEQNHMEFGLVRNAAGKYVKASTEGVTAAAAASAKSIPPDFRVSITNAPGAASYPISSFTYLLIPTQWPDQNKGRAMVDFLHWMLQHGEGEATGMSYAPLPAAVAQRVNQAINQIH